jgi:hypothetical protein
MSTLDDASRSDLEALRRSGRGKAITLGALFLAAVGGAAWVFTRPHGTGNPEDPAKVLVVTRGSTVGYSVVLSDLGFEAAEGTLDAWLRKIEDTEAAEDLRELEGAKAVLALADRFGYGYVAFASPADVDFTGVEFAAGAPAITPETRFAVVSAGDLAFPHDLTLSPPPSPVLRDASIGLLQALFDQAELAAAKPDNESPSVEVIKLRDRLQRALERLARVPVAQKLADGIVGQLRAQLVDDERATPKPTLLGEPLESLSATPTPDGGLLTTSRRFSIVSPDGVRADLELSEAEELAYASAAALPGLPEGRESCVGLAGGSLAQVDSPKTRYARDGSAVLVRTLSAGQVLWTWEPGASGRCAYVEAGTIVPESADFEPLGLPQGRAVVRVGQVDGRGTLSVTEAGTAARQLLGMIDGVSLRSPAWLDDRRLVAIGKPHDGGPDGLYLFDRDLPLVVLRIDASVFEGATALGEVEVGGDEGARLLAVTAGLGARRVFALPLPEALAALFAAPPVASDVAVLVREGLPAITTLDPTVFRAKPLTFEGDARALAVSPRGTHIAAQLRDAGLDQAGAEDDSEIALLSVSGDGGLRLLSRNALEDYAPRFTGDGTYVTFETRVEIPRTEWVIVAARMAKVAP